MATRRTEYRFHGIKMLTTSHPVIRRIKRTDAHPSLHGNKLWKASFLLMDYLKKHQPEHVGRVMDVGCGWGTAGIFCAKQFASEVTSVDADGNVFPYLLANADANNVTIQTLQCRFERITSRQLQGLDLLIAADICFWDELVNPVFNLVKRAVNAGVKKIVIADPERATFLAMAQRCENTFCAEICEWKTRRPVPARGALMIIENA